MVEVSLKYEKDPQLLLDIVSAMPKRVDNTLTLHRNKLLGNIPKSREEFNPWSLLDKMDGGDKMMVLDSCKDLPVDWREIDMRERYGVNPDRDGGVEGDTQSTGTGTSAVRETLRVLGQVMGQEVRQMWVPLQYHRMKVMKVLMMILMLQFKLIQRSLRREF